ncbi:probable G-protein coupled receptor 82 [Pseudophryne corroboree]|uniref:probable G-protein coupled receptor 82 n=1 Tax=Pseudophryne corroboree TaxID=495146 RepID=UPI00308180E1
MCNSTNCLTSSTISSIYLPIAYALMLLPSLSGNIISLWIFRSLSKKTSTHIYLINLAISNVAVSIGIPFQIAYYRQAYYWPLNSAQCVIVFQASSILTHSSMCVSITIFCWIAISRYATLVRHKEWPQNITKTTYEKAIFGQILKTFRNPKSASYLCLGVWLTFLCLSITLIIVNQDFVSEKCCFDKEADIGEFALKVSTAVESTCFFLFFSTVLLFYYFFIKHLKTIQANSCIGEKHLIYSRVKNNIIVIVVLLFVCFTPFHISKLLLVGFDYSLGCPQFSLLVEIKNSCLCLAELRSCTDPIVYFCLDDSFKKNVQLLFKKQSTDEEGNSSTVNKYSTTQMPTVTGLGDAKHW